MFKTGQIKDILGRMNVYRSLSDLQDQDDLFEAGVLDSLILIQFVLALEDDLKVRLKNEDIKYENFKNLSVIASLLNGNSQKI